MTSPCGTLTPNRGSRRSRGSTGYANDPRRISVDPDGRLHCERLDAGRIATYVESGECPASPAATGLVVESVARGYRHGFDILDAAGLPSGTVYPILRPLASARLSRVTMGERRQPARAGPPRYHELTAAGLATVNPGSTRKIPRKILSPMAMGQGLRSAVPKKPV